MTRFDKAWTRSHQAVWIFGAGGMAAFLVPAFRVAAASWTLGLLVGILNLRMLGSALRRGLKASGGGAKAALSIAGVVRLTLVLALLAWITVRGPVVSAWWLVAGVFLPEIVWVTVLVRGRDPYDRPPPEEGDSL